MCDCGGWAQVLVVASGVGYYGYLPSEAEVTRTAPGSPNQLEPRRRLPPDDSDACMPLSGPVSEGFPGRLSESQRGGRGAGRRSESLVGVGTKLMKERGGGLSRRRGAGKRVVHCRVDNTNTTMYTPPPHLCMNKI